MKPVTILLALATKCNSDSQCNSKICATMTNANCDEVPSCHMCAMVPQLAILVRMTGSASPTIAGEENAFTAEASLATSVLACRTNVDGNMQCIDNDVVMSQGGQGPFPVQN
ncbi:hypothetical protein F52700_12259 [Fusarium sp. NRRL 52700]|nr:hypothetical protein F52700_12259 [Fusarium sp. NRRL 52700]